MSPAAPDARTLFDALGRLPPRDAQKLTFRLVEKKSTSECAALYGISADAFAIGLYRAGRLLQVALTSDGPVLPSAHPPEPDAVERERALALTRALDGGASADDGLVALLRRTEEAGPELKALAREQERAYLASPRAQRMEWLRRGALLVLLLVAVYLYLRNRG